MSQPPAPTDGPGPSAASAKRRPERVYTGPTEHGGLGPRVGATAAETERYFAKLPEATQPIMPRTARALGIGSWIVGGCEWAQRAGAGQRRWGEGGVGARRGGEGGRGGKVGRGRREEGRGRWEEAGRWEEGEVLRTGMRRGHEGKVCGARSELLCTRTLAA